jgi:6-phosphofructokinase 1
MPTFSILTSGGDAPGMNAAIRAVTKTAIANGAKILGSLRGFRGLVNDDFIELTRDSVSNIVQRGGSIIYSSRCDEFQTKEGRAKAIENCRKHAIDGLILIGGDGTMKGAVALEQEGGPPSIGLPGTIDNDIAGLDSTIGFDTAVNAALEAIDRIRDTAETMERVFFIETMGRASGSIAVAAGIAGGCNIVIVPEKHTDLDWIASRLVEDRKNGARSLLIVVAEGDDSGGAYAISREVANRTGLDARVSVLGYMQRGGNPTARDRIIATVLGVTAAEDLLKNKSGYLLGWKGERIVRVPFSEARTAGMALPQDIVDHAGTLLT